jgi:hypothetical protein
LFARHADADADAELEARLAAFKGTKNWKDVRAEREGGEAGASSGASSSAPAAPVVVDWGTETVFYEGPPSRGDLAVNVLLGVTLLWLARARRCTHAKRLLRANNHNNARSREPLFCAQTDARARASLPRHPQPLSLAAVGRAIWVNYKITDKRVSVTSTSPLNSEQLDASYAQMKEVRAIGRGIGLWGDMVIVLNDGAKVEIRCIDRCVAAGPPGCRVRACGIILALRPWLMLSRCAGGRRSRRTLRRRLRLPTRPRRLATLRATRRGRPQSRSKKAPPPGCRQRNARVAGVHFYLSMLFCSVRCCGLHRAARRRRGARTRPRTCIDCAHHVGLKKKHKKSSLRTSSSPPAAPAARPLRSSAAMAAAAPAGPATVLPPVGPDAETVLALVPGLRAALAQTLPPGTMLGGADLLDAEDAAGTTVLAKCVPRTRRDDACPSMSGSVLCPPLHAPLAPRPALCRRCR